MAQKDVVPIDSLLTPWLRAEGDEEAEQRLSQLIAVEIEPVISGVIRFKLRLGSGSAGAPEADDLRQEALTAVLSKLRKCRSQPSHSSIGDVRGLAATITYRTCYRWLRRQSPQRSALRNRLQYVLTRQPGLALWSDAAQKLLSGLAAWRGRNDRAPAARLQQMAGEESFQAWAGRMSVGKGLAEFSELLKTIFTAVNLPVEFDELVRLTAVLLRVKDVADVSTTAEEGGEISEVVAQDDVAWQVEKRIFLQRLWEEVQLLPLAQRSALLLNLRDAGGRGCIALFPAVGVASLRQLAAALEMPLEEFAALWNQLPLDDLAIAEVLKLTRQQVINARKAARERLARRLRGFF
jgi:DNA-directed RNA polymerase specialized sigma24 family protein